MWDLSLSPVLSVFAPIYSEALLLGVENFIIFMSSWWVDLFVIVKNTSLSLVILLVVTLLFCHNFAICILFVFSPCLVFSTFFCIYGFFFFCIFEWFLAIAFNITFSGALKITIFTSVLSNSMYSCHIISWNNQTIIKV